MEAATLCAQQVYLTELHDVGVYQQAVVEDLALDVFGDLLTAFWGGVVCAWQDSPIGNLPMNLMATCRPVVLSSARTTKPNVPLLRLRTCGGVVHAGCCPGSTCFRSIAADLLILGMVGKWL